jgi:ribokinase
VTVDKPSEASEMAKQPAICVIGSANVDLTFRAARFPRPGETVAGRGLSVGMGGKGGNQAVAAARLGAKVALVACVGDDAYGAQAIENYRAEGIDVSCVRQDRQLPTGTAAIVVDAAAENCIIAVPGANAALTAADVSRAAPLIQQADVAVAQLETPLEATIAAFALARSASVLTVLTPAPARALPDELLRLCDLCVPNISEMQLLAGTECRDPSEVAEAAGQLRARGVQSVVVTRGRNGALLFDDAGMFAVPAIEVRAVDPTGAGDSFTAALAVSLAEGLDMRQAAERASFVAALAVTRFGTQAIFPTASEVEEFIGGRRPD